MVIGLTYIILVSQTQLLQRPAFHGRDYLLPFAFLTSSQQLASEITKPSLVLLFFSIHKLIFLFLWIYFVQSVFVQAQYSFHNHPASVLPFHTCVSSQCSSHSPPLPPPTPLHVSGQHHLLRESFVQTMSTLCLWIIKWAPGHSFIHPFNQLLTE